MGRGVSTSYTCIGLERENFRRLFVLNHVAQDYQIWYVASSNKLLQKLITFSPRIIKVHAQGSEVLYRPLLRSIVKACQRFSDTSYIYLTLYQTTKF